MRGDETLTRYEFICLFTLAFMYNIFNESYPQLAAFTGPSAWLAQLVGAALAFILLLIAWALFRMYPGRDLPEILNLVYGRHLSKLVHLILLAVMLIYTASSLNRAHELMINYAYAYASPLQIDLLIMAVAAVIALRSVKGLAKTVSILLPLIVLGLVFILVMCMEQYDPALLHPVLGGGVSDTLTAGVMLSASYAGLGFLGVFAGAYPKGAYGKPAALAIAAAAVLLTLSTLLYVTAIPYDAANVLGRGVIGIAQAHHDSSLFQNLESLYIACVVMSMILLVAIGFLVVKKTCCAMFRIGKAHAAGVIAPLALLTIALSRALDAYPGLLSLVEVIFRQNGIVFAASMLIITLILAAIRRGLAAHFRRAACIALMAAGLAGIFSGCAGYHEPDSEANPLILGYDRGGHEKYRLTLRIMKAQEIREGGGDSGEGTDDGQKDDVIVVEAPTFSEGLRLIGASLPKYFSLLHVRMLVISEELAREGLDGLVDALMTYNEIKPTMLLVISRGSAYELVNSDTAAFTASLDDKVNLVTNPVLDSAVYMTTPISDVLYGYKSGYGDASAMLGATSGSGYGTAQGEDEGAEAFIARTPGDFERGFLAGELPAASANKMELSGMAVFRGDRLAGLLTTRETELMMLLNGRFSEGGVVLPDIYRPDEYYISLALKRTRPPEYHAEIDENGRAHIRITAVYRAQVSTAQNPEADYTATAEGREALRAYANAYMNERARRLLFRIQKEYGSDCLRLGRYAAAEFLTVPEWEAYDWLSHYPDADIEVDFRFLV